MRYMSAFYVGVPVDIAFYYLQCLALELCGCLALELCGCPALELCGVKKDAD